jgi:hypothetical protein
MQETSSAKEKVDDCVIHDMKRKEVRNEMRPTEMYGMKRLRRTQVNRIRAGK